MNIWEWLKKLFEKKPRIKVLVGVCNSWPDPDGSHPQNARLARPACPQHKGEYLKGGEPKIICNLDHTPPPPPEPHIIDNPKPPWMPRMVAAVLRLHYDSVNLNDDQLNSFAKKLSLAGVDYIRVMGDWESYFTPGLGVSAFKRGSSGKFDLNQPNLEWDIALDRIRDIFGKYFIKIYFDMIDNCDSSKGPWAYNENGFSSIYDPALVNHYIKFFDRVSFILDHDAKYGLGNEFQGDNTTWMKDCVLPLAEHMYDKIQKPLCFSGDDMTAHHLHGLLSPDVSAKFGIRDSCLVRHWCGTPTEILNFLNQGSAVRCYAYSDDGVFMENAGPEHGPCTPANVACQGTIEQRIGVIQAAWERLKNIEHRMDHIEFLPREISWEGDPNNISEESLRVYNDLSVALWGIDIRRREEI